MVKCNARCLYYVVQTTNVWMYCLGHAVRIIDTFYRLLTNDHNLLNMLPNWQISECGAQRFK